MKAIVRVLSSLLCLLLTVSCLVGCRVGSDTGSHDLKWKKLAEFGGDVNEYYQYLTEEDMRPLSGSEFAYIGREPRLLVLTDVTDMSMLQNQVRPEHQQQIEQVDFSKYWVAVLYQGRREQSEYSITVSAVHFQSNTVTIAAQFQKPSTSTEYQPAPSISPYFVLRIQKPADVTEAGLRFRLSVDDQMISAQCMLEGRPLSWINLISHAWAGEYSYADAHPTLQVIADYETWTTVKNLHPYDIQFMSQEDFLSAFAIIVYQGRKSTTSFETEILSVRQRGNTIMICVKFHEPYPGQAVGQSVTSPYYVFKVDRPLDIQGEVVFVLCTNTQEISRQTVTLP